MFESFLILPMSRFIGFIFTNAYGVSHNYGISLILLSLAVTLIIYPLQKLSDALKARDDAEKAVFAPVLDDIQNNYTGAERYYYTRYLNKLHCYHPIKAMRSLGGLLIQIPFFMGAYHFLGHYQPLLGSSFFIFSDLGSPDGLFFGLNLLPLIMTALNILASSILLSGKPLKEKIQLYAVAGLFLVLLYRSPSALVLYWTLNNAFSLLKTILTKLVKGEKLLDMSFLKILSKPKTVMHSILSFCKENYTNDRLFPQIKTGMLTCISITFIFFVFAPVAFVASDPLAVESFTNMVWHYYVPLWLLSSAILFLIFIVLPSITRRLYLWSMVYVIFMFTLHGYFLPGNYSQMDGISFEKLVISMASRIVDLGFYGLVFIATVLLFAKKYRNRLLPALSIILLCGLFYSGFNIFKIEKISRIEANSQAKSTAPGSVFTFSKNKTNVVVIMLDRAFGVLTEKIFERNPELKKKFEGFTVYPNCVSYSSYTLGGFLPVVGGYDYTVEEINKRDTELITKKVVEAFNIIPLNLKDKGYDLVYSNIDYAPSALNSKQLESFGIRVNVDGNRYITDTLNEKGMAQTLLGVGLFRLAGDLFRTQIYRGGAWITEDPRMTQEYGMSRNSYLQLKYLSAISDTNSNRNNFILIDNLMVHYPYAFGPRGTLFKDARRDDNVLSRYPSEDLAEFGTQTSLVSYYAMETAFHLLGEWLDWMKTNGVYDNTKIILVSDHAYKIPFAGALKKATIGTNNLSKNFFVPLFMVKDFAERDEVKTDMKFMTNAEVPRIILSHIGGGANPYSGQPLSERKKGPITLYHIKWTLDNPLQTTFTILHRAQLINEDIFEDSNWNMLKVDTAQ